MRSFALWYKIKEDKKNEVGIKSANVQINVFKKKKSKDYFFDFGIMVEDVRDIEGICLYVPFKITNDDVEDLGNVISNNQLLCAIFNEDYKTTSGEPKKFIAEKDGEQFVVYSLNESEQVLIEDITTKMDGEGSIITLKTDMIVTDEICKYYFRVRVTASANKVQFIENSIKGNSLFASEFMNTEVIDFRLNDTRSCSDELKERFQKNKLFKIEKINYLVIRSANESVIHYGVSLQSRLLEENVWKNYFEKIEIPAIAYHIKEKNKPGGMGLDSFTNLMRFQYKKNPVRLCIKYVLIIIAINLLSSIIFEKIIKIFL